MLKSKSKKSTAKSNTKTPMSSSGINTSNQTSIIAAGTLIDGHFKSTENIRLEGTVTGDVKCDQKLIIGETGKVEGKVIAENATIMGKINGETIIKGTLELKASSVLSGPIVAGNLIVEEGAKINGQFRIGVGMKA